MTYSAIFRRKVFLFIVPAICFCVDLEINLSDKYGTKPIKIVCSSADNKTKMEEEHRVLWQGREFGFEDQHKLIYSPNGEPMMPNVTIKSTDQHKCYILTPLGENWHVT